MLVVQCSQRHRAMPAQLRHFGRTSLRQDRSSIQHRPATQRGLRCTCSIRTAASARSPRAFRPLTVHDLRMMREQSMSLRDGMRRRGKLDALAPRIDRAADATRERRASIQAVEEQKGGAQRDQPGGRAAQEGRRRTPTTFIAQSRDLGEEIATLEASSPRSKPSSSACMLEIPEHHARRRARRRRGSTTHRARRGASRARVGRASSRTGRSASRSALRSRARRQDRGLGFRLAARRAARARAHELHARPAHDRARVRGGVGAVRSSIARR